LALFELGEEKVNNIKSVDEIISLEYNRKRKLLFAKAWRFYDVLAGYRRRPE